MKKRLLLFILLLHGISFTILAQEVTVSGKVTDENGTGLPGVSVIVKGTTKGTTTDIEGLYKLIVPNDKVLLEFSYVGYVKQTIEVGSRSGIDVSLKAEISQLDEVIVVGYGEQSTRDAVGSVANVKFENVIESQVPENMESLLQGRIAGVNVQVNSGEPGAAPIVIIRGLAAVTRGGEDVASEPLYVIDGIPILSKATSEFNVTGTNILADIDPSDIENISILRDASAAAIYGSRAANGVILVTTKKGKRGKPQITVSSVSGISLVPQLRNAAGGANERRIKVGLYERYNPDLALPILLSDSLNPYYNNATDWQREVYSTGFTQNYNASIRGAGEFGDYSLSVGHFENKGIAINSKFKRSNILMNNTFYGLDKRLLINTVLGVSSTNNSRRLSLAEPGFTSSLLPAPDSPLLEGFEDQVKYTDRNINNRIRANLNVSYDFFNHFTFKAAGGLDYSRAMRDQSYPEQIVRGDDNDAIDRSSASSLGESQNFILENTLTYKNTINENHYLDVLVGQSLQYSKAESTKASGKTAEESIAENVNVPKAIADGGTNFSAYAILSYFSRVNYIFNDKYLISGSLRADGSSKFGDNKKWGVFPSGAIGWTFSNEPFLSDLSFLNFGKLRASLGLSGGQFDDDYLSQGILQAAAGYGGQGGFTPVWEDGYRNAELTWEQTVMYDIGLDLELFNSRVSVTADYYYKLTKGLLLNTDLPNTSGYVSIFKNAADVLNEGVEITLNTFNVQTPDFTWSTNLNFAFNQNRVTKIGEGNEDIIRDNGRGTIIRVGRPINGLFQFESDGIYQSEEEVPVNPQTGRKLRGWDGKDLVAGDKKLIDQNKDFRIDANDRIFAGDPNPDVVGGFSNDFTYKGFYLSVLASFVVGREIVNTAQLDRLQLGSGFASGNIADLSKFSIWQRPGDQTTYPSINPWNSVAQVLDNDDDYIEDGSYFRLQTVTLGYNFRRDFLNKLKLRSLKVYSTVNNVAIFQNYSGPDAEAVTLSGFDNSDGYPKPRYILLGLNIGL
ncbi:SusC/RagA family TonB-linked outer membrane protein [Fulvivirgaceae bacterium BMA12]|uniref:SusC/RagA family TonB-linked outer membrane protein n=1 Tax=Agaribacillus aureus TaxID=3051825 RepID=A0ABT8L7D6_9BACT|nr:SusC/RagA family TonB-linked outer membrane protein [Fulvivirgaceae bacterium BMA12]